MPGEFTSIAADDFRYNSFPFITNSSVERSIAAGRRERCFFCPTESSRLAQTIGHLFALLCMCESIIYLSEYLVGGKQIFERLHTAPLTADCHCSPYVFQPAMRSMPRSNSWRRSRPFEFSCGGEGGNRLSRFMVALGICDRIRGSLAAQSTILRIKHVMRSVRPNMRQSKILTSAELSLSGY
jgi:hypothetical protein